MQPDNTVSPGNQPDSAEAVMSHRYTAIDGLRGFAAISVALHHFIMNYPVASAFHTSLQTATVLAWTGVDLFFVISGFLITQILLNTKSNTHYFKQFYIRRILRIFPLYYTFILFIFFILPLFGVYPAGDRQWTWPYFFTYTSNFLDYKWTGFGPIWTGHFWSLAIEEQFYFVWPLVIYLCSPRILAKLFPVLIAVSVLARWGFIDIIGPTGLDIRALTFTHADGLLIGGWIAFMVWRGWKVTLPGVPLQILLFLLSVGFIAAISVGVYGVSPYFVNWGGFDAAIWLLVISLIYAMLLLCAIGPPNFFKKVFSNSLLRWLGKYSYAIYVLHIPVMYLLNANFDVARFLKGMGFDEPALALLIYLFLATVLTLSGAVLSWYILEQPFLRLKRFFPYDKPRIVATEA